MLRYHTASGQGEIEIEGEKNIACLETETNHRGETPLCKLIKNLTIHQSLKFEKPTYKLAASAYSN